MAKVYKGAFSGTLPITVSGTGTGVLASYKIFGNTVQSGTPTPENPITPSGCGVRTENLFDKTTLENGIYLAANGNKYGGVTNGVRAGVKIKVLPNTAYTLSAQSSAGVSLRIFEWASGTFTKQTPKYNISGSVSLTVTTTAETTEIAFNIEGENGQYATNIMLNFGSTALPYEPYGYKLPLTVNGVEYPIYIGDTQLAKDEYVDSTTGKIYRRTKNLSPPEEEWADEWIWGDGTVHPSTEIKTSPFIDVSTCETCIMEVFSTETEWAAAGYRAMTFYDENKQYLGWIGGGGRRALTPNSSERLSEFPAGTVYVRIGCSHGDQPFYPQLVSGYTPTHRFYPYLVPTDPPAPLPEIPTSAGTTIIDYAGEGLAPSQFDGVAGWGNLPVKKLNGVPYTGALPATLIGTKAGYLHRYKIYGNMEQAGTPKPDNPIATSGCGERTENLAWTGWAEDFVTRIANVSNAKLETKDGRNTVYFTANVGYGSYDTKYIFVTDWKENTVYTFSFEYFRQTEQTASSILAIKYTDGTTAALPQYQKGDWYKMTYSTASNKTVKYLQAYYISGSLNIDIDTFMVIEGSSAPTTYEPYGYKLPLTSGDTPVDIYIGDDTLSTEEYVDSGTGKIYRRPNLYDTNATDTSKGYLSGSYLYGNNIGSNPNWFVSEYMPILADTDYIASGLVDVGTSMVIATINVYNSNKQVERYETINSFGDTEINSGVNGAFIRISARNEHKNTVVVKPKNAAPVDPPAPLPQIPTFAGTTIIDYAGEGLAPSQFDSIQEWVDKQTYTRVNGEWVAE